MITNNFLDVKKGEANKQKKNQNETAMVSTGWNDVVFTNSTETLV